jgi:hypothetical protein
LTQLRYICYFKETLLLLNVIKNTSPLFPKTTPMYLPEIVSYDIAVIAKLMLWDTMFDKSRFHYGLHYYSPLKIKRQIKRISSTVFHRTEWSTQMQIPYCRRRQILLRELWWMKEQVCEKRCTVSTHSYVDCLLKNMPTKHNTYVVNQLELLNRSGKKISRSFNFTMMFFHLIIFMTRVTRRMILVEHEMLALPEHLSLSPETVCWKTCPPSITHMLSITNSNIWIVSVSDIFLVGASQ